MRVSAAQRAWSERKARQRGSAYLPGLRRAMERTGTNPRLIAEQVKLSHWTIHKYATGESRASREGREAIAETLGVSVAELEGRREVGDVGKAS